MINSITDKQGNHPQLAGLKTLWSFPDEILNKVLWVNTTSWEDKETAIGYANEYLDFMDAIVGVELPEDAWEEWCILNRIDHEIDNNPYID